MLLLSGVIAGCAGHGSGPAAVDPAEIAGGRWRVVNRAVSVVNEDGWRVLRFDEQPDAGMAWNPALEFRDGDIDVDVRGRDVMQKSFVGIAFHVQSPTEFDVIWLRPFNFVGIDSAHHVHAVQYASYPEWSWERLREEHPGGFESAVPPTIRPDAWVHLHLEIRGRHVAAWLDHAERPVLSVDSPGGHPEGSVALWVGDKSPGDFANLVIHPLEESHR
jgi:hypothetical protein